MRRHPPRSEGRPVVLWSDTFTNYFHPEVGRAAVTVLERLGYFVMVPPQTCCGRPLYDFGLLESAHEHLERVFDVLAERPAGEIPIVVLEPSCFAVFKDEALNLFGERSFARMLAQRTQLFSAFIRPHLERRELPVLSARALMQIHCHQRALAGAEDAADGLRAAGLDVSIPDTGCCGMAGSFGFDRYHYPISMQAGERVLLPAVRAADQEALIIADGFSCREQIQHATGRRAYHVAQILERTGTVS